MRGVRSRLVGAVGAASITLMCVIYAMLASMGTFGATFALAMGVCAFGAAVALVMSARHEEEVHELASQFDQLPVEEPIADRMAVEEPVADATRSASGQTQALPEPNPLDGLPLVERPELGGVSRERYSNQTDGAL